MIAGAADAHHSFAMFDGSKTISISGTIVKFEWTNPHVWIYLSVPGADGSTKQWGFEGGSPMVMGRSGWNRASLKPGDKVVVTARPAKDGSPVGSVQSLMLSDGRELRSMGSGG